MRPPATHSGAPATACQDGKELTVMNPALMGKYCKSKNIYHWWIVQPGVDEIKGFTVDGFYLQSFQTTQRRLGTL